MRTIPIIFFLLLLNNEILAQPGIDSNTVNAASALFDLNFTSAEKDSMLDGLRDNDSLYQKMHAIPVPNSLNYPFAFNPLPVGATIPARQEKISWAIPDNVQLPKNKNELAFYSVMQLASLVKNKKISSVELTNFFIA